MSTNKPSIGTVKTKVEEIGDIHFPRWSSLILYTIGVVIMLGLTIKYVCPIINNYFDVNENVAVKIGVENNFSQPYFPSIYMCVPGLDNSRTEYLTYFFNKATNGTIDNECELCRELKSHAWDFWKDEQNLSNIDVTKSIIEKLQSENSTNFHFLEDFYTLDLKNRSWHWQLPIFEQLSIFFKALYSIDQGYFEIGRMSNYTTWPEYARRIRTEQSWNEFLIRDDREIDQLFRLVAEFYLHFFSWGAGVDISNKSVDYLQKYGNIFEDPEYCVLLPPLLYKNSKEQLNGTYRAVNIDKFFNILTINEYSKKNYYIYIHTDTPILRGKIPGFYLNLYSSKDLSLGIFETVDIKYTLQSTVYEKRKNIVSNCYNEKSKVDCLVRCKVEKIRDECHCVPFAARMTVDRKNTTYCNRLKNQDCGMRAFARFNECDSECTYVCRYDIIQWQVLVSSVSRNQSPGISAAIIPYVTPYLRFDVIDRDGIEDLISQVGGLFNFYLGWSGLSLIFALVYAWDCYRRLKASTNGVGTDSAAGISALRITTQWMWLTGSSANDSSSKIQSLQDEVNDLKRQFEEMKRNQIIFSAVKDRDSNVGISRRISR